MINIMNPSKQSMKEVGICLDPQLWHACAGGMVQMPAVNSKVFYFPQGHMEHAQVKSDLKNYPKLPALIPCCVSSIKYLADQENDEVYAKIRLVPFRGNDFDFCDEGFVGTNSNNNIDINSNNDEIDGYEKPASFAKTLTQSDANNGGGFSVPRYCAETIFPRLDYNGEPPVQTIFAKDVHGVTWKFRHIYRGTPRRHLLTTGWSNFVNQKKLVAGDSIVFLKADNGDLCVGIRRPKRGVGGGIEYPLGWNNGSCGYSYGGFLRDDEGKEVGNFKGMGQNTKIKEENVVEAAKLAANGVPFEVVYYPRSSTPEFFVKASVVKAAMQVRWCGGMRFKMAFETEDSSRISWFTGTVSSVQVDDPICWPNSSWRLLQVAWDEPELLQNVKRVNPWLVELVSSMPTLQMSPLSPPRKKLRLPQSTDSPFPFHDRLPIPTFPCSTLSPLRPLFTFPEKVSTGIQGARQSEFGHFTSDLHLNKINPNHFTHRNFLENPHTKETISSFIANGNSEKNLKKDNTTLPFMLFGKTILTEKQISEKSGDSTRSILSESVLEKIGSSCNSSSESGYPGYMMITIEPT